MRIFKEFVRDAMSLARGQSGGRIDARALLHAVSYDGYSVLAMTRVRQCALRWHVPFVNRTLRFCQMAFYGLEIAKEAEIGEGVNFMHTLGTVVGGDSRIGPRTIFLGNNTIGNLDNRGYPSIGADVVIGAGARILGPISIGDGAKIGANAVVVTDVPPGATAVGIPAKCRVRN